MLRFRVFVLLTGLWAGVAPGLSFAQAAAVPKVLRYAFPIAETGFDPAQITDLYSRTVAAAIFDAPLTYDYLARPITLKTQTAVALPEASADFRSFTFRIRPGIYFADDPAFKGAKRELVAEDYVYSLKRHYDPQLKSGSLFSFENAKVLGLSEVRKRAIAENKPFPYDEPVEGARTLDRYTFVIKLAEPNPRFIYHFADAAVLGAVAREVIEAYPGQAMEHPVGTGPFRLAAWKRSSRIVLERNPAYREELYDAQAPANDAGAQAIAQRFRGQRLPMLDRVEIAIVEEPQPRWLAFLNAEHDLMERLPAEFAPVAIPKNVIAPNLARQGIVAVRTPLADAAFTYFGMEHPVVGGYTPDKVALRRALALAYDTDLEVRSVRKSQAIPAQGIIAPMLSGYDPAFKSEMSDHSLARAKALLDLYGYVDRNNDGWRDMPDGQPLVLEYSSQSDQSSRQLQELWKKAMDAVNVRFTVSIAKWPEQLKASRAGKLMMWGVAWSAANPDGSYFLDLMYGPNKGQANHARFDLPAFNDLYKQQLVMPDGPEREALMKQAKMLGVAYMPYKVNVHRTATDLMHPWVVGYRRHPFVRDFFRYVSIDTDEQARRNP